MQTHQHTNTATTDESTKNEPTTRRIHRTLGRTTAFWRGYTAGELLLFALPPLVGLGLLGMPFTPSGLLLPVAGVVGLTEGVVFLAAWRTPDHYRLGEWLAIRVGWQLRPSTARLHHDTTGPLKSGDETPGREDTRSLSRLHTTHPYGVERDDGALVGAVEISPANMALRDDEAWSAAARGFADLVDSSIEFDLQLFVTTTTTSEESQRASLADRLSDADVRGTPLLRGLISRRLDRLRGRTPAAGTGPMTGTPEIHRRYYAVVTVDDEAATAAEPTATEQTNGSVRDWLRSRLHPDSTSTDLPTALGTKQRLLDERLDAVKRGVAAMPQCSASTVEPRELAELLHDYWTGHTVTSPHTAAGSPTGAAPDATHAGGTGAGDTDGDVNKTRSGVTSLGTDDRAAVAPSGVKWEPETAILDKDRYARTFWIEQFPEHPSNGLFERLLLDTELCADLSIHIEPIDRERATDAVADWISTLQTTRDDGDQFHAADTDDEIARARRIRELIRKSETDLYRVGVFVRVTAPSRDMLRQRTQTLEALLRDAPANCLPKRVTYRPEAGLATVSPIGRNELGSDRCSVMTGDAVGALFPFSSDYLRMDDGVEYGRHGHNASTVRIDPWALETGHSELVTGTPGGGKTHGTQARCLRTLARHDDIQQVIIDPVGDMREMARALGATELSVADATAINPCALHPPSQQMRDTAWEIDPIAAKKEEVFALIENFLSARGVDLDTHSGIITYAIDQIYDRSNLDPEDPTTHTPANSPTLDDLLAVIDDLSTHPERHALIGDGTDDTVVADRVAEYATDLALALEPFRAGSVYSGLAERSETAFVGGEERLIYIDLQEIEGTSDGLGKQSFLMQLLLGQLYQQAKHADDRVEIIIDEAHYLCQDAANLAFLNQIARHQRHAGLRLVLLSQTLYEFYDSDAAEEIAGMCPIKIHHREPELDDATADRSGLSADQRWFVRNATAGSETTGYSEALLRADEHGDYPLTIRTEPFEQYLIDDADGTNEKNTETHDEAHLDDLDTAIPTAAERTRMVELAADNNAIKRVVDRCSLDRNAVKRRLTAGLEPERLLDGLAAAIDASAESSSTVDATDDERAEDRDETDGLLRLPARLGLGSRHE